MLIAGSARPSQVGLGPPKMVLGCTHIWETSGPEAASEAGCASLWPGSSNVPGYQESSTWPPWHGLSWLARPVSAIEGKPAGQRGS